MAVVFDAVGPSSAGASATAATSASWSHTTSGSNRAVIVGVAIGSAATTTVTYAGAAMTSLGKVNSNSAGGTTNAGYVQLFGLIGPAAGTSTIAVSTSATTTISAGSVSFTGVASFGTGVTASGSSAAPSVAVAGTAATSMVTSAVCTGTTVTSSGQTLRWLRNTNQSSGAGAGAASTAAGTGGTVTMTYAVPSDYWGIAAVEVKAATSTNVATADTTDAEARTASTKDLVGKATGDPLPGAGLTGNGPDSPAAAVAHARASTTRSGATADSVYSDTVLGVAAAMVRAHAMPDRIAADTITPSGTAAVRSGLTGDTVFAESDGSVRAAETSSPGVRGGATADRTVIDRTGVAGAPGASRSGGIGDRAGRRTPPESVVGVESAGTTQDRLVVQMVLPTTSAVARTGGDQPRYIAPVNVVRGLETDTAFPVRPTARGQVAPAQEQDSTFGVVPVTARRNVTAAVDSETAFAIPRIARRDAQIATTETSTAFVVRPTGSYPTKIAAERDYALLPTNANASTALELSLAEAIAAPDRSLLPTALAYWDGAGTDVNSPFLYLTSLITEMTIVRSLEGELPAEVGLVEGHSAAQANLVLAGEWEGTDTDPVDAFAPYKTDAYFYGKRIIGIDLLLGATFRTPLGTVDTQLFAGSISSVSPSSASREVQLAGLDGANKLRAPISLAPFAIDSLLLKRYGEASYFSRINSQWLIDYILRQNGVYASAPLRGTTYLSATLHGSTIPEVGFGGVPQEHAVGSPPTGPIWVNDGSPTGMLYPSPAAPAMTGAWKLASAIQGSSGTAYDIIELSFWVRLGPLTPANGTLFTLSLGQAVIIVYVTDGHIAAQFSPATGTARAIYVEYKTVTIPTWYWFGVRLSRVNATQYRFFSYVNGTGVEGNTGLVDNPGYFGSASSDPPTLSYNLYMPISDVQVSLLQTTNDITANPTAFVPQATIDIGANSLFGVPAVTNEDSWELLKDIVAAEYGSIGFDHSGAFWFRSRAGKRPRTDREIITSERNLADLHTTTDEAGVRNVIAAQVTPLMIGDYEDIFVSVDVAQLDCGPGTTYFYVSVPDGTQVVAGNQLYFQFEGPGRPDWTTADDYKYRDAARVATVDSAVPTQTLDVAVYIGCALYAPGVMRIRIVNNSVNSIRFATPNVINQDGTTTYGEPAFRVGGRVVREQPEQTVAISDPGSIDTYGPRVYDLGGDNRWHQHPASVNGIASGVLATIAQPVPVLERIEVPHDPRRALHDAVRVIDNEGLGQVDGTIVGIETHFTVDGPATDTLDVRPLGPPGLGRLDDPELGVVGSTLVFGS